MLSTVVVFCNSQPPKSYAFQHRQHFFLIERRNLASTYIFCFGGKEENIFFLGLTYFSAKKFTYVNKKVSWDEQKISIFSTLANSDAIVSPIPDWLAPPPLPVWMGLGGCRRRKGGETAKVPRFPTKKFIFI